MTNTQSKRLDVLTAKADRTPAEDQEKVTLEAAKAENPSITV